MKIVKLFLAGIAAITLTSGCEALAEALDNSLSFLFSGTTIYDGQTALLGVTYKNDVAWNVDKGSDLITLTHDDDGKNCIAKVKLSSGTTTLQTVQITNRDKYDNSVEKNTGVITIAPWRLQIFKQVGENEFKDMAEYCSFDAKTGITTLNLKNSNAGTGTYKVKMMGLNDKNEYASFAPIYSLNLFNHPEHRVYWESSSGLSGITTASDVKAEGVYEKLVKFDALPSAMQTISVYLGKERDEKGNVQNPKTYDKNYVMKTVAFVNIAI